MHRNELFNAFHHGNIMWMALPLHKPECCQHKSSYHNDYLWYTQYDQSRIEMLWIALVFIMRALGPNIYMCKY